MEKYDVVIIGSGLGGLECGVILSKEGYNVCVIEKNKQLGGNLQTFSRNKKIFDTGVHYIGGLDEGQNLYRYFKYMGIMQDLKLKKLDELGYDAVTFENDPEEYKHAQGYDNFVEVLTEKFPLERENLEKYVHHLRSLCDSFPMYNVKPGYTTLQNIHYLSTSAKDFIASCTSDTKLQKVLAATNVLYAGEGSKTPLYVHAMIINSYIESSYRCVDGGSQIARLLTRIIRNNGGKVINKSEACGFEFHGNKIRSVVLKTGEQLEATNFISNIHPVSTLEMIEEGKMRGAFRHRIGALENSTSAFVVYIVLKDNSLPYFNYNIYHTIGDDVWNTTDYGDDWPKVYAAFPHASSKNAGFSDTLVLLTYMKYSDTKKWADTCNLVSREEYRGGDYEEFKREKAEKLIDEAEKKFPGLRKKIVAYYTSTPLTYRDYIGSKDGTMYGIMKDYNDPMKTFISPRTKISNLFFTGQNLNMHGVLGVTIGSVVTCSEFLGNEYLMTKIQKA